MGDLLAMLNCKQQACVLTSRMELHVHDLKQGLVRELPLMLSSVMGERSVYAVDESWYVLIRLIALSCLISAWD